MPIKAKLLDSFNTMKPTAILRNYYIDWSGRLRGTVFDHPCLPNGSSIITSRIVEDRGATVETRNTIYILE